MVRTRVLFLSANPKDTDWLAQDDEFNRIDEALKRGKYNRDFDAISYFGVKRRHLAKYLEVHTRRSLIFRDAKVDWAAGSSNKQQQARKCQQN